MVHADSSTFRADISKEEAYAQVLEEARGLFDGQRNWVIQRTSNQEPQVTKEKNSNLSNTASLLWHAYKSLPSPSSQVNWAGFYTLDPSTPRPSLILGPFQGKVACQTIDFSRGVCGTAAATKTTQLIPDVDAFPGHIACDSASQSEIVVPIVVRGVLRAIIDVDCEVKGGFDEVDRKWLEELAGVLAEACDW